MPVSGNEEPRIIARHSSACSAGVPIKKRRFPLVRPPSPRPQEPSSLPTESDSVQSKQSTPSQGSSTLDANTATNSPGKSDVSNNSFSKVKKEGPVDTIIDPVQNIANLSRIQLVQPPSTGTFSGSMDNVGSKENLKLTQKSLHQKIPGNTELHLAPNKALAVNVGKEMLSKQEVALAVNMGKEILSEQEVEGDCKIELSTIPGSAELSLGPKEPLVPALNPQNCEGSSQMADKLDTSLLLLSLSKGKPITQGKIGDLKSNNGHGHVCANRSNWDLNTTMDSWEGSVGDAGVQDTVGFDGLNKTGDTHDIKPSLSSTGMVGVGVGSDTGKQILGASKQSSNFTISSLPSIQHYNSEDSLHLSLGTCFPPPDLSGECSDSSAKLDSSRVVPKANILAGLPSAGNINSVSCRQVKSEPLEENAKYDCVGAGGNPVGLLDLRNVKHEPFERHSIEAIKVPTISPQKLVEHRSIKPEAVLEINRETPRTTEISSHQSIGKLVECQDNHPSTMVFPLTPPRSCPLGLPTCSQFSLSGDISNQSEYSTSNNDVNASMGIPQEACGSIDQVAEEMVSISVGHEAKESHVCDGMINACRGDELNVRGPDTTRLKLMHELPLDSRGNGEGTVSDEEKINISADMLEDDSYDSDYESDGNHDLVDPTSNEHRHYGREDDEYEDGEVQDPLVQTSIEGPIDEEREAENVKLGGCDNRNVDSIQFHNDGNASQPVADEKDGKMEELGERSDDHIKERDDTVHKEKAEQGADEDGELGERSDDHIKECVDTGRKEKAEQGADEDSSLREPSEVEVAVAGHDEKKLIKGIRSKPFDQSGREDVQKCHETEVSSDGATNGSQGTVTTVGQAANENIKGTDTVEKTESILPKTESSLNGNDASKYANSGGNRSRIINLPRASNVTSPCKTRSIPGRSLPSRTGKERYPDFEQGNRDEIYTDGSRKYVRDRIQDQSLRSSRLNFMRGRGRGSSWLDTLRNEWDSARDFAPDIYSGPSDYRFPRHKRTSAVADAELECNGYVVPDGAFLGTDRARRKPLNVELPTFRHPSNRRLSPGGRDGPTTRGIQMIRRINRNISPSRCTADDGSDLVGLRHDEKFMRGLANDIIDPVFTRPQPPYEGLDGQFFRGNINFSSVQRRGLSRIRSKSPIRSRTRSPGPWSSPHRRSPDGFNGIPELTHRRSPAIYRMDRIRSPDRPCFPEEIVARRHDSPPYMARISNEVRDMDSGRNHGHPRPIIPNRSPSDRILPRSTRRFDMLDPRERTDSDEYFGGPMRSGRFHELGGDGNGDERRKCSERRGPIRSFRPPYNGADGVNFRFHLEDGSRPFRICPEADSEFERSNLREREFDSRIKNRTVIAPRRFRSMEDQEGNYRHSGQVWHDDGFDDVSRVKKRRF